MGMHGQVHYATLNPWFWHSQYVTELDSKGITKCPVTFCVLGVALLNIQAFCDAMMCQLGNRYRRFEQTTTFYLTLHNAPKDLNPYVQWSAFSKRYFLVIQGTGTSQGSGVDTTPADRTVRGGGGGQKFGISKFVVLFFSGLDSVLQTEGNILDPCREMV